MLERYPSKDVPAWYKLNSQEAKITMSVHKQALSDINERFPEVARGYQEALKLPHAFVPPSSDREWGFGSVISEREDKVDSDWLIYECDLPSFTQNGETDWDSIYETAATLQVLLRNLKSFDNTLPASTPQMIEVSLRLGGRGQTYGGYLGARVKPALAAWLNQNIEKDREPVIAQAMMESYFRMCHTIGERREYLERNFRVLIRDPKWINLDCPGDSCGLDPKDYYNKDIAYGYELRPHNTDTPLQQLTLLSGLAKLDKLAHDTYAL